MRQLHDDRMYEERESRIAEEIVNAIKSALTAANLSDSTLKELTEEIAFSVAAIVDGSSHMPIGENDHMVPILGFAEGRMRDRLLVPREGGSSVHGLISGYVALAFESEL
jgi:hypothetical protein